MEFNELHRLIKKGDVVSLRRELDGGLNPSLANQFSWSLLMLAALQGDTSIGDLLISRGADVDATNNCAETALSLAAHSGHTAFITLLVSHGAKTDCRPHGASLEDWLRVASGLSPEKVDSILSLLARD